MKNLKCLLMICLSTTLIISCNKTEVLSSLQNENSQLINDEQVAETTSTEIDAIADEAFLLSSNTLRIVSSDSTDLNFISNCPIITYLPNTTPKRLFIEFGQKC